MKPISVGLSGGIQRAGDGRAGRQGFSGTEIQQLEAVSAGDVARVGRVSRRTEGQRVSAWRKLQDGRSIVGVAVAERAVRDQRTTRTAQRPAQVIAVVAEVGSLPVKIDQLGFGQREGVDVALPGQIDGLILHLVQIERDRIVTDQRHIEAVGAHVAAVVFAFHEQRIAARIIQCQRADIVGRRVVKTDRAEYAAAEWV